MNKSHVILALSCALFNATVGLSCGPFFPITYTDPAVLDGTCTNTEWRAWSGYSVTQNPRYELSLLGWHFFPEWAGRKLRYVPMSSDEAHRADYAEAAAAAGMKPERIAARTEQLLGFADAAKDRILEGRKAALPSDLQRFEREFFLYALGRAQRLADPELAEPPAWRDLLALPPERRQFRTVWARHGLVLAAPDVATADSRLREMRADLNAGFRDTCGLEEAMVAQLMRRSSSPASRLHWLPLAAVVSSPRIDKALVDDIDWLRNSTDWRKEYRSAVRDIVASDKVATEVFVTIYGERLLPDDLRGAAPVLCAGRRAWVAFDQGDFERGRTLLALAPENSLVRLFWEARLARIDGDYARSAALLRKWLAEVAVRGGVPSDVFEVRDGFEGWFCDTEREYKPRTRSFERVVEGELGGVLVTQGDYEEALLAFLRARSWIDAAFVAERCMTADRLAGFVRGLPRSVAPWTRRPWAHGLTVAEDMSWLAARRLLREGRIAEAGEFFPEKRKPEWRLYASLVAAARPGEPLPNHAAKDDARALASFNLARLLYVRGMELLGTELEPDVFAEDGGYSYSGIGERTAASLPRVGVEHHEQPLPKGRFHYRALADEAARRTAALAEDPDVRVAALMLRGRINQISYHGDSTFWTMPNKMAGGATAKSVQPAYRELCAVPGHPLAEAAREARWFPWKAAGKFLSRLDDERSDAEGVVVAEPLSLADLRALLR